jgi:TPR repeat protein
MCRGDTTATMLLGECYLKGEGVPKDEYVAARQFEKAAAAGSERGMYEFGKLLLKGAKGVEKDEVKARRMFGMAAKQGHGPSCLMYGLCLATGTGGIRSMADGMVWLHAAADDEENPSVEAMLNLGMAYIRGESIPRNVTRGMVYLEAAAAQGDARACHELGEMKLLGDVRGVKQDAEEAVRLLTDACDAGAGGHTMWLLGRCYAQGDGCEVDDDVAAIWFLKSARDGAEGWGDAGVMRAWRVSEKGERVPPPDIDWAKGAADRGSVGALKLLGWCYDAGVGVTVDEYGKEEPIKRDVRAASIAMKKLGDLGDEEAMYSCGMLLAEAPDKNLGRPLQCFEESAKRGWPPAMRMLGRIHAKGLVGLPKDEQAAVEWYARAAEKGDAEAAYQLGLCYQYGKGVQQDMFLATEYYHDAADEGDAGVTRQRPLHTS